MRAFRTDRGPALVLAAILAGFSSHALADEPFSSDPAQPMSRPQSFLQPVVCSFDFEQPDAPPNALPTSFVRNIAPAQGFPNFGSMRLSTDCAYSGERSFEFQLGGGSMSASVPTSIIPILPFADYSVSAKVRTKDLKHAGARLVAWLHDVNGKPIHESRAQSEVVRSDGLWQQLTVEVHGHSANAADLVVELQLVQPSHFDEGGLHSDQPREQDIAGFAWFDDVQVVHLPRVRLAMAEPGHVVSASDAPEIRLLVSELSSEPLMARLRVFNIDGETMFDSTFPAPRGKQPGTVRLPQLPCGWYRAVLQIEGDRQGGRLQHLDFTIVPDAGRAFPATHGACRFGVVLDDLSTASVESQATLISAMRSTLAIIPVWQKRELRSEPVRQASIRSLIDALLRRSVDLVFAIDVVPDRLASAAGVESDEPYDLMLKDPATWRPELEELLVSFGLEVRRWQIGAARTDHLPPADRVQRSMIAAERTLEEYVPDPQLYARWPIEVALPALPQSVSCTLEIPAQVAPAAIEEYAQELGDGRRQMIAHLELLEGDRFTPRQCLCDALLRGLYCWRSGFPMITIAAPWKAESLAASRPAGGVSPTPVFAAWRVLAEHLSDRVFAGELPVSPGSHCWIVRGLTEDAALVAWSDFDRARPSATTLTTQLADGPVRVVDVFGNARTYELQDGLHRIPLTNTPVFIHDVNLDLVQFRSGFSIDPPFMPAIAKIHEHEIVLQNPWDVSISGLLRLSCDETLTLQPTTHEFNIGPRSEARLPMQIIPDRNIVAGRRTIHAHLTLQSDRQYDLHLETDIEVGLKNIELVANWAVSRNPLTGRDDLVITESVTNKGDKRVNLDVYLLAQGVGQNRRTIVGLGPSETAVRTFRIEDGFARLAGQQIRVGVSERDGLTRLNQVLLITSDAATPLRASAPDE